MQQSQLFLAKPALPEGMAYEPDFLSPAEEVALLETVRMLPFSQAQYKEWTARRRVVSYGGRYDFHSNVLNPADPIPDFLQPVRERIAAWSGVPVTAFNHALVAEYSPGTQLGWHRDVPDYEVIVGLSLAGNARMRLRPYPPHKGKGPAALALEVEPRSVYRLQGTARWAWQHAISPAKALRYSLTFRTLVA